MISRAIALASAMSLPTSMPSHTSAHSAELVRRGGPGQRLLPGSRAETPALTHQGFGQTEKSVFHGLIMLFLTGRDELLDPPEPERELILRLRVREADEAFARVAERSPGKHRDAGLVQQPARELVLVETSALDVRKHVERALGSGAAHARDLVEAVDDEVAAVIECLDHAVHGMLRLR